MHARISGIDTYYEYVNGSWVVTSELKAWGSMWDGRACIGKIFIDYQDAGLPHRGMTEHAVQVIEATVIDYRGSISFIDEFSDDNPILLHDNKWNRISNSVRAGISNYYRGFFKAPSFSAIQVRIPREPTSEERAFLYMYDERGDRVFLKLLLLSEKPVELTALAEKVSQARILDLRMDYLRKWLPQYILICCWLGVLLDGYTQARHGLVRKITFSEGITCMHSFLTVTLLYLLVLFYTNPQVQTGTVLAFISIFWVLFREHKHSD